MRDARRAMVEPLEPRTLLALTGPHAVTVNVFRDLNRNGVRNSNDPPLQGFDVRVNAAWDAAGRFTSFTARTDASGQAKFAVYMDNGYRLRQTSVTVKFSPARWRPTNGGSGPADEVSQQAAPTLHFGITDWGRVTGAVYMVARDADGEDVDRPLVGRLVFDDTDRDGRHDAGEMSTVTGHDGAFRMELRSGHRVLRVALGKDWSAAPGQKLLRSRNFGVFSGVEPFRAVRSSPVTIDVLAAYTPAAADGRSDDAMSRMAREAILGSNYYFANSDTNVQLRPVGAVRTRYTESGSIDTDLTRLSDARDGLLDDVHHARDRARADLVVLFTRGQPDDDVVGLAYQYLRRPEPKLGFSVVTTHNGSVSALTLAHEIGHNLGAGHDAETVAREGEVITAPYAHGYHYLRRGTRYLDIMAFGARTDPVYGDSLLPYFSTPLLPQSGTPAGDAETADNARIIREVAPVVARYR